MSSSECCGGALARRSVLTAAVAGTATLGLAACASAAEPTNSPELTPSESGTDSNTASESSSPSEQAVTVLGATSAVAVGGGTKFELGETTILVTQPQAGEFVGFDATCTHQGCVVTGVTDGEIRCGCHGAKFDIASGQVLAGPAESPLKGVMVSVVNDEIVIEN